MCRRTKQRLARADHLAEAVALYVREHDHPVRDGAKLSLDFDAMVKAMHDYYRTDLSRPQPSRPPFSKLPERIRKG